MELNKEYTQINVNNFSGYNKDYNALSGKIIDKVGFTNCGGYDCQMLVITFTDKTFIAVGPDYNDDECRKDEPKLDNQYIYDPKCLNNGDYRYHSWTDSDGKLHFEEWIDMLRDLGLWIFTDEDAKAIIGRNTKAEEEREYQNYLRLKKKFEPETK